MKKYGVKYRTIVDENMNIIKNVMLHVYARFMIKIIYGYVLNHKPVKT